MATTSLWAIKGRIDHLISYVENPEKTKKTTSGDKDLQTLWNVLSYTTKDDKTENKLYVSGINCIPQIAVEQMIITKKQFAKDDGRLAYHGFQSFLPGEVTPELAHEIGMRLAKEMWGNRYQIVVATHLDRNHIHSHFAFNSVSFLDGKKYDRSKTEYVRMRVASDRLCREYGLSVIENPSSTRTPRKVYFAEKAGEPTRYNLMRWSIDEAIKQSTTTKHFFAAIENMGYELKLEGKYWTLKEQGTQKPTRFKTLGEDYAIDSIKERILANISRELPLSKPFLVIEHYKFKGNLKKAKKIGGFRGLYLHYCYLLGILPKNNPRKPSHPLLREEIRHMQQISEQAKMLFANKIETIDQLHAFVAETECKKQDMIFLRHDLANIIRRVNKPDNLDDLKDHRETLTKEIGVLNRQIWLAVQVEERSKKIRNNIAIVRQCDIEQRQKLQKQNSKNYYER